MKLRPIKVNHHGKDITAQVTAALLPAPQVTRLQLFLMKQCGYSEAKAADIANNRTR